MCYCSILSYVSSCSEHRSLYMYAKYTAGSVLCLCVLVSVLHTHTHTPRPAVGVEAEFVLQHPSALFSALSSMCCYLHRSCTYLSQLGAVFSVLKHVARAGFSWANWRLRLMSTQSKCFCAIIIICILKWPPWLLELHPGKWLNAAAAGNEEEMQQHEHKVEVIHGVNMV